MGNALFRFPVRSLRRRSIPKLVWFCPKVKKKSLTLWCLRWLPGNLTVTTGLRKLQDIPPAHNPPETTTRCFYTWFLYSFNKRDIMFYLVDFFQQWWYTGKTWFETYFMFWITTNINEMWLQTLIQKMFNSFFPISNTRTVAFLWHFFIHVGTVSVLSSKDNHIITNLTDMRETSQRDHSSKMFFLPLLSQITFAK